MLEVKLTSKFKKDYKLLKKRRMDMSLLKEVVEKLANQQPLEEKYRNHELTGKYKGFRECRVQPDWLLIYLLEEKKLTINPYREPLRLILKNIKTKKAVYRKSVYGFFVAQRLTIKSQYPKIKKFGLVRN